jgi:hypothetical protein
MLNNGGSLVVAHIKGESIYEKEFEYHADVGLLNRINYSLASRVRKKVFQIFMREFAPTPQSRTADLGVTANRGNPVHYFFETLYPHREGLTAIGRENAYWYPEMFPGMKYINADLRAIPLPDRYFDYGICNAVVEHGGPRESQAALIREICRVCKNVMVITPNGNFPVDPHTLVPIAHWLPKSIHRVLLQPFGLGRFADIEILNPLNARALLSLFPATRHNRLSRAGFPLLPTNLVCISSE